MYSHYHWRNLIGSVWLNTSIWRLEWQPTAMYHQSSLSDLSSIIAIDSIAFGSKGIFFPSLHFSSRALLVQILVVKILVFGWIQIRFSFFTYKPINPGIAHIPLRNEQSVNTLPDPTGITERPARSKCCVMHFAERSGSSEVATTYLRSSKSPEFRRRPKANVSSMKCS